MKSNLDCYSLVEATIDNGNGNGNTTTITITINATATATTASRNLETAN